MEDFFNLQGGLKKDTIVEAFGGGVALFDYDADGWLDVLLVGGTSPERLVKGGDSLCRLYRSNHDGTFTDVTRKAGLSANGWGMGIVTADYDNDGYEDIYLVGFGPNKLFRNNGDGTFTDVTDSAGVGGNNWSSSAAFGDLDNDGDLDLYVSNYLAVDMNDPSLREKKCPYKGFHVYCGPLGMVGARDRLYRNNGDHTFQDVTEEVGIDPDTLPGLGVLLTDLDGNGYADIYVANDLKPNLLYVNEGRWKLFENALIAGVAFSVDGGAQASMGVDSGDFDGDGKLDLFVSNFSEDYYTLYQNDGGGFFLDRSWEAGVASATMAYLGWGLAFADFNNDSWLDLFVVNGHVYPEVDQFPSGQEYHQRNQYLQNLGNGTFKDVSLSCGEAMKVKLCSRGAAFGDMDNDGDVDIVINNIDGPPRFLRNEAPRQNHWLSVQLSGTQANRGAIGAILKLEAAGRTQLREVKAGSSYASTNDKRVHFGLGKAERADLEIRWPGGRRQFLKSIPANQRITVREESFNRSGT